MIDRPVISRMRWPFHVSVVRKEPRAARDAGGQGTSIVAASQSQHPSLGWGDCFDPRWKDGAGSFRSERGGDPGARRQWRVSPPVGGGSTGVRFRSRTGRFGAPCGGGGRLRGVRRHHGGRRQPYGSVRPAIRRGSARRAAWRGIPLGARRPSIGDLGRCSRGGRRRMHWSMSLVSEVSGPLHSPPPPSRLMPQVWRRPPMADWPSTSLWRWRTCPIIVTPSMRESPGTRR